MKINKETKRKFLNSITIADLSNYNGCWNWTGSKRGRNYGQFGSSLEKERYAHRISWMLFVNHKIEYDSVLHTCDDSLCVNPRHLFLGDQNDNMKDMARKGRAPKGENSIQSFLLDSQIVEIRKKFSTRNYTQRALAREYKCSEGYMSYIINDKYRPQGTIDALA